MGCLNSTPEGTQSAAVNRQMAAAQREEDEKIKLLLLGAGESGKSTIMKQMKNMYGAPMTAQEVERTSIFVQQNVLTFMKVICEALTDPDFMADGLAGLDDNLQAQAREFAEVNTSDTEELLKPGVAAAITALWKSDAVKAIWERRNELQVTEVHTQFVERVAEIASSEYQANFQDLLLCRVKTSGIMTESLKIEGILFDIYDVGGQKNERRKWIHCFDNVSAIIFVVGLSEYDKVLLEDDSTNRMADALDLFKQIFHNPAFAGNSREGVPATKFLVFLNKKDLFEEKLKRRPIGAMEEWSDFDDFAGIKRMKEPNATDFDCGVSYFENKFAQIAGPRAHDIIFKPTQATDTENVKVVWEVCLSYFRELAINQF